MLIRWSEFSGRPGDRLFEKTSPQPGASTGKEVNTMKIGLTTDPMRTWSEQRWEGWGEMVVIYSTSSRNLRRCRRGALSRPGLEQALHNLELRCRSKGSCPEATPATTSMCCSGIAGRPVPLISKPNSSNPPTPLDGPPNPLYNPCLQKRR